MNRLEEILPSVQTMKLSTCILQGGHCGLQWQTFGALIALQQTAGFFAFASCMMMPDVSNVVKEPCVKHQQLTRYPAGLSGFLHAFLHFVHGGEAGESFHQPQDSPIKGFIQDGHSQVVPAEFIRHRQEANKFPEVRHLILSSHLPRPARSSELLFQWHH